MIIKPKEDPAHTLLRKVWDNKETNNHDKYNEIQAKLYNSVELYIDSLSVRKRKDSNFVLKGNKPGFILENLGYYFQKKGNKKELIEHTISNMPKEYPSNLFFSPQQIPSGFYDSEIPLNLNLGGFQSSQSLSNVRYYLNPIDPKHFEIYEYKIIDTLINTADSSITITFNPKNLKRANTFKGNITINTNKYPIESINAQNADKLQNTELEINQLYKYNGQVWFPSTRIFDISFGLNTENASGNIHLKYIDKWSDFSKNILDEKVVFDGALRQTKPKSDTISRRNFYKLAANPDSVTFNNRYQRIEQLELKKTWQNLIETPLKLMRFGMQNGIPLGDWFLVLNQFAFNKHELARIGMGIQNDQINNPRWRFYGSGAWAYGDRKFKYESVVAYHMTLDRYNKIEVYSSSELERPGLNSSLSPNYITVLKNSIGVFGDDYVLDKVTKIGTAIYIKPFNYTQIKFYKEREIRNPLTYRFNDFNKTDYWQTGMSLRFAYKESLNRLGYAETVNNFNFPIAHLNIVRNLSASGPYSAFYKASGSISHIIKFEKIGKSMLILRAGKSWGQLPYPYLFNSLVRSGSTLFIIDNSGFFGISRTETVLNEYLMFMISHDFESSLLKTKSKIFKPELRISYNFALGNLNQNNVFLNKKILPAGNQKFHEYSLAIRNLLVFKVKGFPLGLGIQNIYTPDQLKNPIDKDFRIRPFINFNFF